MKNNKTIRSIKTLVDQGFANSNDVPALTQVIEHFSLAISPTLQAMINPEDPNDPIAKQFVPEIAELNILPNERLDPIGDDVHAAVKGIVHRYPDRCLFMPLTVCPVYCRFCFRKEKVGDGSATLTPAEIDNAFAYINQHPEIWEVIITGGDPFILKPKRLKQFIDRLAMIPHVEVIRIHTRVPVVDPSRINDAMIQALKCNKAVFVVLHANHPNEFTKETLFACKTLVDAGFPMLSQTILLKNLNDNIDTLSQLMRLFIKNRIKPYYLHHCDLARGTSHFRTTIAKGQQLMKALRGRFSGICQPTYVLDIPGGYGKVPIGPNYLHTENSIEDYQGCVHEYVSEDG